MRNIKPKSINALMAYMREKKSIKIEGSIQKKKLRYMGYFHGYKGYRYHGNPRNRFSISNFNELQAIYDFDMSLKTVLYPQIMFLETTLKNYALEVVLADSGSKRFAEIYSKLLIGYKAYPVGSREYRNAINKRLNLRNKVYSVISRDYGKRFVVNHYYDKDEPLPIWAIFELLSLGEFATFLECLKVETRKEISHQVGVKKSVDADGKLLPMMLYSLKDLRNAVAHNNTVFDTRFHASKVNGRISRYIEAELKTTRITFDTIVDYIILIGFLMKLLGCSKKDIMTFIRNFENICEIFRSKVPPTIYMSIIYTDSRGKLGKLKEYI